MTEYIYKLNLPPIEEVLIPGKYQEIFIPTELRNSILNLDPSTYLKKEYREINGYKLNISILFYKSDGWTGKIHLDGAKELNTWAINYIVGGRSIMRYYDSIDKSEIKMTYDFAGNYYPECEQNPKDGPSKEYHLSEGVYLVRTDIPHAPQALGKRYCLSIRAIHEQRILPWEIVVAKFKHNIIH